MLLRTARNRRSTGFTLIELLVVMAIIAILIGLISAAVMRIAGKGPDVVTQSELGQFGTAIDQCKSKYNVPRLPSRLVLYENVSQQRQETVSWGRLTQVFGANLGDNLRNGDFFDWNGNGRLDNGRRVLEGHECLVFFLGGIPQRSGGNVAMTGFAANSSNPTRARNGRPARIGPFFQFNTARLVDTDNDGFLSYQDGYERNVYAFFAAGRTANSYGRNDNQSLRVQPYYSTVQNGQRQHIKPNSFQIISAGKDGVFGTNYQWQEGQGLTGAGSDNLSNFSNSRLGS